MRCPHCQAQLSASAQRCGVCGATLPTPSRIPEDAPAPATKPRRRLRILTLGILLLVLQVILYVSFSGSAPNSQHPAGPADYREQYEQVKYGMTRIRVHEILGPPADQNFPYSQIDTRQTPDGHTIEVKYGQGFDKSEWIAISKDYREF